MTHNILLNNKVCHFDKSNLPCLIHYENKTGGSLFSMTLFADLFLQGFKTLMFTAYLMAKDNFFEQTKGMESKIFFVESKEQLSEAQKYQAIILKSSDGELFLNTLESLSDISERIILVKNIEVFEENILNQTLILEKIILSGNLDKCIIKKQITEKQFKTIAVFSESEMLLSFKIPKLEKFTGYLKTIDKEGFIKIGM